MILQKTIMGTSSLYALTDIFQSFLAMQIVLFSLSSAFFVIMKILLDLKLFYRKKPKFSLQFKIISDMTQYHGFEY